MSKKVIHVCDWRECTREVEHLRIPDWKHVGIGFTGLDDPDYPEIKYLIHLCPEHVTLLRQMLEIEIDS
jgi:hypothetical protein